VVAHRLGRRLERREQEERKIDEIEGIAAGKEAGVQRQAQRRDGSDQACAGGGIELIVMAQMRTEAVAFGRAGWRLGQRELS